MDSNILTLKEFFIARNENRLMEYVLAHKEYARQEINGTKQYLLMQSGIRRIDHLLMAEYSARRVLPPASLVDGGQNVDDTK
jgi:hypothetical protein